MSDLVENMEKAKNWDHYFYMLSCVVAKNSRCLSREIGAVLTRDKRVIGTGYNGPPVGIPHCDKRCADYMNHHAKIDKKLMDALHEYTGADYDDIRKDGFINKCPKKMLGFESGQGLEFCIAAHAERNSLLSAAKNGTSTEDTTMYMSCGVPCKDCLIEIINAGVKEVVVSNKDLFYDEVSKYILNNSDLKIREYKF